MRKIYWYVTAFLRKHGWKVLLAFVVTLVFFSFLLPYTIRNLQQSKRYYVGVVGEYYLDSLPEIITTQISKGLTIEQTDGSFLPDLAEKISIEDDGRIFRFTLAENHYWQDGTLVVPNDIVYSLPDATATHLDNEIVYELADPFAPLPQYVASPLIRIQNETYGKFFSRQRVVGIGDYEVTDFDYRDNSAYSVLKQVVVDNKQTKERYIYRFYTTEDQALLAFKKGEVDILFDIANPEEVKDWQNTLVSERDLNDQYLAVFFNQNDPMFSKNVRQALSYAIEKEHLGMKRAVGPIMESSWAYFSGLKKYDKSYERGVERLLDEMPGQPLEIKLTTLSTFYSIGTQIKTQWEELGQEAYQACMDTSEVTDKLLCENLNITVEVNIQNFPDLNNYQVLLIGQQVSGDPDQYNLWHSDVATNFTHYKNTRVDSLLEKGRQTINQKERLNIYQEFQQVLVEDPPAVFLWTMQTHDLARK